MILQPIKNLRALLLSGGLSNTHTYYLNQFYLRISYIDKSYKKASKHRTSANSIHMNILQTEKLPPAREHLSLQVSFAGEKKKPHTESTLRTGCSHQKNPHLRFTLPHLQDH